MPKPHTNLDCLRHVIDDWTTLQGREVDVHLLGTIIDRGCVDDVMPDGALLWLANDATSPRRIIQRLPDIIITSDLA